MKKALIFTLMLLISASSAFAFDYQEGDVIGHSEVMFDPSTILFEAATSSRFGHVGVVLKDAKGKLVVYEANPPQAGVTSLKEFMKRNGGSYAVIRKSDGLTDQQLQAVKKSAADIVAKGTPYNFSMVVNDASLNCSEFVRKIFASAGIDMGRVEVIDTLHIHAFNDIFLNLANSTGTPIDLKGLAVTPVSVMQASGWNKVDGPLQITNTLSDHDLFLQWKKEGITDALDYAMGISEDTLEKAAKTSEPPTAPVSAGFCKVLF